MTKDQIECMTDAEVRKRLYDVSSDRDALALLVGFFLILTAMLFVFSVAYRYDGINLRAEAVRLGHAKYLTDEYGCASFTWAVPAEKTQYGR